MDTENYERAVGLPGAFVSIFMGWDRSSDSDFIVKTRAEIGAGQFAKQLKPRPLETREGSATRKIKTASEHGPAAEKTSKGRPPAR